MPTYIEIEETFCRWMDVGSNRCTYVETDGHLRPILLGPLARVNLETCAAQPLVTNDIFRNK